MRLKGKVSILWKVTSWYTMFLVILAVIVVAVIYLVSGKIVRNTSKSRLVNAVESLSQEIEYEDGKVDIDDVDDCYEDNIYIIVYDKSGNTLTGFLPNRFPKAQPVHEKQLQLVHGDTSSWFVYDSVEEVESYGPVIIRGVHPTTAVPGDLSTIIFVLIALLPLLILIATVGGFVITKRAFRPISQMRETVEQISDGKDLTRRVNLGDGNDEIYKLGHTFNRMFERLEDSFEREKQFTSDVSHELRTPISVMLSQCEYAMEQVNPKETTQSLGIILKQSQKMHRLIQQLLMLSRCDQGFEKLHMERFSLSELFEIVVEEAEERAELKHIKMKQDIQPEIIIEGDETLIMRMLVNLLNNAINYGNEDGWIKVSLTKHESVILGMVEDNGIGINPKDQEKIWNRFYQVNAARTSGEDESMGLGLSMVKWIIEAHGGTIRVESELGKGSRFLFELMDEKKE